MRSRRAAVAALLLLLPAAARAQDGGPGAVAAADLGSCPTAVGEAVRPCRLAYRTFGRLNAARDNAVLVPTWYGGRSETMTFLLGADAWIDTTRYFAILVDGLGFGVSSSPSTSEAQPGRRFPRLTLEDMVDAQRRLVTERLSIRRLHAVVGWSMGGMQALAWGLRYPELVDRVVSVAGTPRMGTSEMYWVRASLALLELAERARLPRDTLALRLAELWHTVATTPARENALPRDSVDAALGREAAVDWAPFDPEDNRLQLEALARFDAFRELERSGWARRASRPRLVLLYVPEDHVTTPESFRTFARLAGAETVELPSACGHLAPVCEAGAVGERVRGVLDAGR
ncbi:MAG TPA: alpha/beta fold hydrolase [Gemmatimonadales bacterium]|nr:alpha/beta fold hydrolase [Gemmatimonadales bacterium]